jgi:hypothetical protein
VGRRVLRVAGTAITEHPTKFILVAERTEESEEAKEVGRLVGLSSLHETSTQVNVCRKLGLLSSSRDQKFAFPL